ncbi:PKD domain-containing protein [Dactylosporangium sp. CS-033363]|uniref:PKD domain-containing protein n=1 Tax=Dactylosporangium sp. CS-033363 TaxID=3239935 RepID=UPI003D9253EB
MRGLRLLAGCSLLTLFVIAGCGSPQTEHPDVPAAAVPDRSLAVEVCQRAVLQNLKAPATARFVPGQVDTAENRTFRVSGAVDAQNSFGALIRTSFDCNVALDGRPQLRSLAVDGRVVVEDPDVTAARAKAAAAASQSAFAAAQTPPAVTLSISYPVPGLGSEIELHVHVDDATAKRMTCSIDFGDGSAVEQRDTYGGCLAVDHTYAAKRTYKIVVTVANMAGVASTATKKVDIR